MTPSNQAAWLTSKSCKSLEVKTAPYTRPGPNEIVVKNHAIAMNPLEWFKQDAGGFVFTWVKYPFVMGSDVAGEVVEVGKGVTRFKVGDRVLANAVSMDPKVNESSEGAFQLYTVVRINLASPIPDSLSYENACVLPLCASTAACALFMKDFLALQHPTMSPKPTGKMVLIWGGSTAVGSNAIQLATAAGYEVITTASPKNFEYVKKLGAVKAFDYRSPTVVKDIIAAFAGKETAGAVAIGNGSTDPCIEIIGACKGRRFVAQATADLPDDLPSGPLGWMAAGMSMGLSGVKSGIKASRKNVSKKFIWGTDLLANEVGKAIYEDFLPAALAQGKYMAVPEPLVVGKGLQYVQEGLNTNKKGVSARKVIVTL